MAAPPRDTFDYIIVGAGSAGCVLANRLSADPAVSVALVEAGPSDRRFPVNLKTAVPVGNVFLLPHDRYNWNHAFTGGPGVNNRSIPCPRGRLFGGCSSVNGSVYMRGHPGDYDDWAALGNEGWDHAAVLDAFKRHERRHGPASELHGTDGELDVGLPRGLNPVARAFVDAAVSLGHARNGDFNGGTQDGFGPFELNQRRGVRLSASRAFLHPALSRPNLRVFADTTVERIRIEGSRARGVTVVRNGRRQELAADAETIVCGGTINSPQLLMLSGIGPRQGLVRHGIGVVHELPGVGRNLQDHVSAMLAVADPAAQSYALSARSGPRIALSPLRYLARRDGMLASNAAEVGGFVRTRPGLDRPDIQITMLVGLKNTARVMPRAHGTMILIALLRPLSRGHLELASADPHDKPVLHPNFLDAPKDLDALVGGVEEARRIYAAPAMARFNGAELAPGAAVTTRTGLEAAIRQTAMTCYHPVGTCRMGPAGDRMAVVDPQLRVHGIDGLRVADASIMPDIVGGNTSAPAMMIGERAAAFILQRNSPPDFAAPRPARATAG